MKTDSVNVRENCGEKWWSFLFCCDVSGGDVPKKWQESNINKICVFIHCQCMAKMVVKSLFVVALEDY
jgi:hypothetical protein